MIRFVSCTRPTLQDWERWLFHPKHRNQHREPSKVKKQRIMFQMKEQDKTSGKNLNEMEISKLPDKAFRVMVINMLTELRRMNEYNENFNREIENI